MRRLDEGDMRCRRTKGTCTRDNVSKNGEFFLKKEEKLKSGKKEEVREETHVRRLNNREEGSSKTVLKSKKGCSVKGKESGDEVRDDWVRDVR